MLRPLKLKIQKAPQPVGPAARNLPVAIVWVDSGIPTLTESFSYLIPEKISEQVQVGSRVQVPFKDKQLEALVIAREPLAENNRPLKSIYKLLGDFPVANLQTIELIKETANFWGGTPYDVVRSAIPARVATAEKNLTMSEIKVSRTTPKKPEFHLLPAQMEPIAALLQLLQDSKSTGRKLIIVPTLRDLERLGQLLIKNGIDFRSLDSNLPRVERYRNFLEVSFGGVNLVIGMRAAVFAPIPDLAEIYLHQENSEHYFERRTPFWNAREVAWLRSKLEGSNLILTGYVPSIDVAIDIEAKEISFHAARNRVSVVAQTGSAGELIPSKIYQVVRKAMVKGPVLFLVPAKGYATAISCAKCRNLALCDCGGKLLKSSAKTDPVCVLCNKQFIDWKCGWCDEKRIFLTSRGIERIAEEIGRSFPNQLVIQSNANDPRSSIGAEEALVISTPGVEPIAPHGYAAVVILQVDRFLSSISTTGVERAYSNFFAASALLATNGVIALVHEDGSPIVSALTTWNPATISKREIEQRVQLQLPPVTGAVLLYADSNELSRLKRALENAKQEGRAPSSLRIYGPATNSTNETKLTLLVNPHEQLELISLLREINKRRGISKKELISYRVNPYSLD